MLGLFDSLWNRTIRNVEETYGLPSDIRPRLEIYRKNKFDKLVKRHRMSREVQQSLIEFACALHVSGEVFMSEHRGDFGEARNALKKALTIRDMAVLRLNYAGQKKALSLSEFIEINTTIDTAVWLMEKHGIVIDDEEKYPNDAIKLLDTMNPFRSSKTNVLDEISLLIRKVILLKSFYNFRRGYFFIDEHFKPGWMGENDDVVMDTGHKLGDVLCMVPLSKILQMEGADTWIGSLEKPEGPDELQSWQRKEFAKIISQAFSNSSSTYRNLREF